MKEQSIFIEYMGDSPTIRMLDYLLSVRGMDFSISDLARNSGIGRATLYRIWDNFIKNKIVVLTRVIGRAKLYKLNQDNLVIKKFIEIDQALIMKELKRRSEMYKPKLKH